MSCGLSCPPFLVLFDSLAVAVALPRIGGRIQLLSVDLQSVVTL